MFQRKEFLLLLAIQLFKSSESKKRYRKLKIIYRRTHRR